MIIVMDVKKAICFVVTLYYYIKNKHSVWHIFFEVLAFELWFSYSLGMCSTIWSSTPQLQCILSTCYIFPVDSCYGKMFVSSSHLHFGIPLPEVMVFGDGTSLAPGSNTDI
jgi:hypothetical protein